MTKAIEISHCHYGTAFSLRRKPTVFTSDDTLYIARMTKDPNDYAIFGVSMPIPYDDKRDRATNQDNRSIALEKKLALRFKVKESNFH